MKIDGQEGVLGSGFDFLVFMTLHIHAQSIFFGHKKNQKVEHPSDKRNQQVRCHHSSAAHSGIMKMNLVIQRNDE